VVAYTWSARRKPFEEGEIVYKEKPHPLGLIIIPLWENRLFCWPMVAWMLFGLIGIIGLAFRQTTLFRIYTFGFNIRHSPIYPVLYLGGLLSLPWLFWFGYMWPGRWHVITTDDQAKIFIPRMLAPMVLPQEASIAINKIASETGTRAPSDFRLLWDPNLDLNGDRYAGKCVNNTFVNKCREIKEKFNKK
jgi:hypothetical protein